LPVAVVFVSLFKPFAVRINNDGTKAESIEKDAAAAVDDEGGGGGGTGSKNDF
jgi:hypothetical protein